MFALHKDICKVCLLEAAEMEEELENSEESAWWSYYTFCLSTFYRGIFFNNRHHQNNHESLEFIICLFHLLDPQTTPNGANRNCGILLLQQGYVMFLLPQFPSQEDEQKR